MKEVDMSKYVYALAEGNKDLTVLLGGKGVNLAEMTTWACPPTTSDSTLPTCDRWSRRSRRWWRSSRGGSSRRTRGNSWI
jgi:hypothetical protein